MTTNIGLIEMLCLLALVMLIFGGLILFSNYQLAKQDAEDDKNGVPRRQRILSDIWSNVIMMIFESLIILAMGLILGIFSHFNNKNLERQLAEREAR